MINLLQGFFAIVLFHLTVGYGVLLTGVRSPGDVREVEMGASVNKQMVRLSVCLLTMVQVGLGGTSTPAPVDAALRQAMASRREGQGRIPVVVKLDLPPDTEGGWRRFGPGREAVAYLKERAAGAAGGVMQVLSRAAASGQADRVHLLWVAGAVSAEVTPEWVDRLAGTPGVRAVELDQPLPPGGDGDQSGPNPSAPINQHLLLMNVDDVWNAGFTGKNVVIAHIDTGVLGTHPDLADHIWANAAELSGTSGVDDDANGYIDDLHGWNFREGNQNATADWDGHGTLTAGLAAGDGQSGKQTGAAPDAELMILRRGDYQSTLWSASQYAIENGADVILHAFSVRWGEIANPPGRPDYATWRQVAESELAAGILHVNSAGNRGLSSSDPVPYKVSAPGNCPPPYLHGAQAPLIGGLSSVLAVANVEPPSGTIQVFSSYGPSEWVDIQAEVDPAYPYSMPSQYRDYPYGGADHGLLKPDFAAYGQESPSTSKEGGYGSLNGTSSSAAYTVGIVALLLEAKPDATPAMLAQALYESCQDRGAPGWDAYYGEGILDAYQALLILQAMGPCSGQGGDADGDTICGNTDNCPLAANLDQADLDGDGTGNLCDPDADGDSYLAPADDCDDLDPAVHPGAPELCDGVDNNCLAGIDENPEAGANSCSDADLCTADLCSPVPACSYTGSGLCGLEGRLYYYRTVDANGDGTPDDPAELSLKPVEAIGLDLLETGATPDGTSGPGGAYALPNLFGSLTLTTLNKWNTPRGDGGATGSVSSEDAALIAKSTVGLTTLTPLQKFAADVSGNLSITAYDASLAAQFAVELIDHFPVAAARGSDFAFLRCDGGLAANCPVWPPAPGAPRYSFTPLAGPETADFYALLFGDVSGNWPSPPSFRAGGGEGAADVPAAHPRVQPMTAPRPESAVLYLAEGPVKVGPGKYRITLGLKRADGIQALDMNLGYDPAKVSLVSARPVGLAREAALEQNDDGRQHLLALYQALPMQGTGPFLEVILAARSWPLPLPFEFAASANEGLVPLTW